MGRSLTSALAFLVGLGFVTALFFAVVFTPHEAAQPNIIEEFHKEPKAVHYASDGLFGKFDREQLQRGFQVYKEVCSACHSIRLVHFRDLEEIGFSKPEVKAIAKQYQIEQPSINPDTGEPATRKNLPSDPFPWNFANETAARAANNNALPPDLSLMTKAREGGAPYIYSLLTGFQPVPANLRASNRPAPNLHYNPYFANLNIAMPPPLTADGQVQYGDGTKPTVDQMAQDVSAFLVWTAEPKLEARHRAGVGVIIFLLIATVLVYLSYRNIWAGKKH